ncbi:mitochondrial aspartate-glutamate transporter agc1 [Diplodia intermedia]|uniref:Mitochondrial aspartate-glutamate transporter agc1 n=1 Tax=Diplodia intermedia TaxID=856260 RepID=A0ABR3TP53_9PEZI
MTDIRDIAAPTSEDTQTPWVLPPADWGLGGSDGRSTAESNGQDAIGAQMTDIRNVAAPTSEDYHKIKRDQYGILFDVADRKKTGRELSTTGRNTQEPVGDLDPEPASDLESEEGFEEYEGKIILKMSQPQFPLFSRLERAINISLRRPAAAPPNQPMFPNNGADPQP